MNKAIDFYLRDMKGYIGELAAALKSPTAFSSILVDLEKAVIEKSFVMSCPFCGGEAMLNSYHNAVEIQCDECGGKGGLTPESCELVWGDFEKFHEIIDERFGGPGSEWNLEKSLPTSARSTLTVSLYVIAAWWSISKWNRRI